MKLITAATNLSTIMEFQLGEGESVKPEQIYTLTSQGYSEPITIVERVGAMGNIVDVRVERGPEPYHHIVGAVAKLQDL